MLCYSTALPSFATSGLLSNRATSEDPFRQLCACLSNTRSCMKRPNLLQVYKSFAYTNISYIRLVKTHYSYSLLWRKVGLVYGGCVSEVVRQVTSSRANWFLCPMPHRSLRLAQLCQSKGERSLSQVLLKQNPNTFSLGDSLGATVFFFCCKANLEDFSSPCPSFLDSRNYFLHSSPLWRRQLFSMSCSKPYQ